MASRFKILLEDKHGTITDEYEFESGTFILGRSTKSDITLAADNVSRKHAKLFTKNGMLFIEDLGSANGTFVNGRKIKKATILFDGSVVKIGDFHIHIAGGPKDFNDKQTYLRLIGLNKSVKDAIIEMKDKTAVIGRGNECQLIVVDPSVSRVHARFIAREDGTVVVNDTGSANGTFVNGKRVKTWELHSGDILRIGDLEFNVEIPFAETTRTRGDWLFEIPQSPWKKIAIGTGVVVVLILLIWLVWPSSDSKKTRKISHRSVKHRVAKEKKNSKKENKIVKDVDVGPLLKEVRSFMKKGELEEADRVLQKAIDIGGITPEIEELIVEIKREKKNHEYIAKAGDWIKQEKWDKAAQSIINVPSNSVFYSSSKALLSNIILPGLYEREKVLCRGRHRKTKSCKDIKKLVRDIKNYLK